MSDIKDHWLANNLHLWDERVPIHLRTKFYNVHAWRGGASSLTGIEREALGDVSGQSILHLQCHFGQDSLSLARAGAKVTGVDFSANAIDAARQLSSELNITANFIKSDIYDLPQHLSGLFDIVFTSYGVLKWLPDIDRWGEIVARYIKPGGIFFIVEFHPFLYVFDYSSAERIEHSYFPKHEPISYDEVGTYADLNSSDSHALIRRAHAWSHPLSVVLMSLIRHGLILEDINEYPYSTLNCFPFLVEEAPERYVHNRLPNTVPLLYSIKCRRPTE